MRSEFTTGEIKEKYDSDADKYALMERVLEVVGIRRLRQRILGQASGRVLEVACGTGANFPYYPQGCELTAIDVSQEMMALAAQRSADLELDIGLQLMDAEQLAFPDSHFDTVVSTLTVCTFPDPIAALEEMQRVCREEGQILLLEHGRSSNRILAYLQDAREEAHAQRLGCYWNREPLALVKQAGLEPISARRTFFGIYHEIKAQ